MTKNKKEKFVRNEEFEKSFTEEQKDYMNKLFALEKSKEHYFVKTNVEYLVNKLHDKTRTYTRIKLETKNIEGKKVEVFKEIRLLGENKDVKSGDTIIFYNIFEDFYYRKVSHSKNVPIFIIASTKYEIIKSDINAQQEAYKKYSEYLKNND